MQIGIAELLSTNLGGHHCGTQQGFKSHTIYNLNGSRMMWTYRSYNLTYWSSISHETQWVNPNGLIHMSTHTFPPGNIFSWFGSEKPWLSLIWWFCKELFSKLTSCGAGFSKLSAPPLSSAEARSRYIPWTWLIFVCEYRVWWSVCDRTRLWLPRINVNGPPFEGRIGSAIMACIRTAWGDWAGLFQFLLIETMTEWDSVSDLYRSWSMKNGGRLADKRRSGMSHSTSNMRTFVDNHEGECAQNTDKHEMMARLIPTGGDRMDPSSSC